ncbi:periplasmic protein TonB [Gammaproteobacteria bacterium]
MPTKEHRYAIGRLPWSITERQFDLSLIISLLMHLIGIFLIRFDLPRRPTVSALEVILVNYRDSAAVKKFDYLAEVSQHGSGTTKKVEHVSRPRPLPTATPLPAPIPQSTLQSLPRRPRATPPSVTKSTPPLVSLPHRTDSILDTPRQVRHSAAELIASGKAIVNLVFEPRANPRVTSERPRSRYINASTQEYKYAAYMEAWRLKVERIGNLNYPIDARRQEIHGGLILDVAVDPDGEVRDITVVRGSGQKLLDDAAIRIVRMSAPFAPFPSNIRADTDILHITRTWQFREGHISSRP